jgi:hypothetical protein
MLLSQLHVTSVLPPLGVPLDYLSKTLPESRLSSSEALADRVARAVAAAVARRRFLEAETPAFLSIVSKRAVI